jgi:glycosyltransferase involved in cell wall biosynthesis
LDDAYLERLYSGRGVSWWRLLGSYWRRLRVLLGARHYDLLWIEKELFPNLPAWAEQLLSALSVPYVVDYDDAIFHNYDLSRNPLKKLLSRKIDQIMRSARVVVCGNDYLAQRAHKAGAGCVVIVPTVVDVNRYAPTRHDASSTLVVGWMGSPSTVRYLKLVDEALGRAAEDVALELLVVGARFESSSCKVRCEAWSEESEVSRIQEMDVGIMPLENSPWERGKCGYKLIQYMACALPVIASPVGVNRQIVREGQNGFCAESTDDWARAFIKLAQDKSLRQQMGHEGRKQVEEGYSLQTKSRALLEAFSKALGF